MIKILKFEPRIKDSSLEEFLNYLDNEGHEIISVIYITGEYIVPYYEIVIKKLVQ